MNKKEDKYVVIFSNTFWSIYNFRRALITALLKHGHKVMALSANDAYRARVEELGCETMSLKNFDAKSTSVLKELKLVWEIRKTLRQIPFDYIFTFTIKPNLYTALNNVFGTKKTIITVNGLGNVFSGGNPVKTISLQLFRIAFNRSYRIVFQNQDDYYFFHESIGLRKKKVLFVRGSGINVKEFSFSQRENTPGDRLVFLLACRLLKEKGIFEYIEAARRVKVAFPNVQFWLIGMPAINQSAIHIKDLAPFEEEGIIKLVPPTDEINHLLEDVDVSVLPSYYNEGVPRILLESLSKGLPVITTDSVGCRETVKDGQNGYLVEPKNVAALEEAFQKMISLPVNQRQKMRRESRWLAETAFDESKVIDTYLGILNPNPLQVVLDNA